MSASDHSDGGVPDFKGLKIAVIVMGILLVAGFIVILGTIIYRASLPDQDRTQSDRASFQELALPGGSELINSQISEDRLVLTIRESDGALTLVIIDLETAHLIGQVRLAPGATAHAALEP